MYVANQPRNLPLLCCMCSAYHSCSQLCNLPEPESKKMIIAGVLQGIWTPMTSFSETALMKKQSISELSQENNKHIRSLMFFDVFCCILARFQKNIYDNYDTLWYYDLLITVILWSSPRVHDVHGPFMRCLQTSPPRDSQGWPEDVGRWAAQHLTNGHWEMLCNPINLKIYGDKLMCTVIYCWHFI